MKGNEDHCAATKPSASHGVMPPGHLRVMYDPNAEKQPSVTHSNSGPQNQDVYRSSTRTKTSLRPTTNQIQSSRFIELSVHDFKLCADQRKHFPHRYTVLVRSRVVHLPVAHPHALTAVIRRRISDHDHERVTASTDRPRRKQRLRISLSQILPSNASMRHVQVHVDRNTPTRDLQRDTRVRFLPNSGSAQVPNPGG